MIHLKNYLKIGVIALTATIATPTLAVVPQTVLAQTALSNLIAFASLSDKSMLTIRFKLPTGTAAKSWRTINSSLTKLYMKKIFTKDEINSIRSLGNILIAHIPTTTRQKNTIVRTEIIGILKKPTTKAGMMCLDLAELQQLTQEVQRLLDAH